MSALATLYPQPSHVAVRIAARSTPRDAKGESRNLNTCPDTFMPAMPAFFAPAYNTSIRAPGQKRRQSRPTRAEVAARLSSAL